MKILFSKKCLEYEMIGHPESPERVKRSYELLKAKGYTIIEPSPCLEEDVLLVHTEELLEQVKNCNFIDYDTPALPDIYEYSLLSAGSAVKAMKSALRGEIAFSLMRPPGHHATRNNLGGFCYFNNIAIAIKKALEKKERASIIDIDCHHGNGTEDIFLSKKGVLYVSLHQSPLYPGTGIISRDNCLNYPLPPYTNSNTYLEVLNRALEEVKRFNPDIVGVSAGFDTYKKDPLCSFLLDLDTYRAIGEMLKSLNKPLFTVLEGGYDRDLPLCIENYLEGIK